ncbi:peptidoglycan-binding domain-containing protein [Aliinostoc sp. HNIBRCY26]|uniref:peptidoglycan-binding domain-containing protein n=1 Tax=Aliinostoc sp. HNIBRCY26 TaxID=3418997 RepID=UPI003D013AAA
MNSKLLALISVISIAATVPAYAATPTPVTKNNPVSHAVQNTKPSATMQAHKVEPKANAKHPANQVANRASILRIGSRGEAVKTAQNLLKRKGFYTANVNGIFDKNTRSAVVKFQKKQGLRADGVIGHKTLAALQ